MIKSYGHRKFFCDASPGSLLLTVTNKNIKRSKFVNDKISLMKKKTLKCTHFSYLIMKNVHE